MAEARTRPRKRGEGQWGMSYFEPLNPAERAKRDDDGLNVRARIESKYAKHGFHSIDKTDLRSRFRWWDLYTQRRQGISAAIIQWAATEEQKTVAGTLADLPVLAAAASMGPPATLVVGAVAALAHDLSWARVQKPATSAQEPAPEGR